MNIAGEKIIPGIEILLDEVVYSPQQFNRLARPRLKNKRLCIIFLLQLTFTGEIYPLRGEELVKLVAR